MKINANKEAIEVIEKVSARDLSALKDALEDGAALQALGIDDQEAVEDAHAFCVSMISRIASANRNLEHGFFWLSDSESENFFQMCCDEDGEVDPRDTGADWGLCGDYNFGIYKSGDIVNLIAREIINKGSTRDR